MELKRCDITKLKVQCIVNAANESGLGCFRPGHPCIDNAIHKAAGSGLLAECRKLGGVPEGVAKLTGGHKLPCQYIMHVTGPKVTAQKKRENHKMLAQCYRRCLDLCVETGIKEIAFCCLSTGIFGFDKGRSATTAISTVQRWLRQNPDTCLKRIVFVVWTDEDEALYREKLQL